MKSNIVEHLKVQIGYILSMPNTLYSRELLSSRMAPHEFDSLSFFKLNPFGS